MKKVRQFLRVHWRLLSSVVAMALLGGFLMLYRLGSLTGGLSNSEISEQAMSQSWHAIVHNPLNAPLTIIQRLLVTVTSHHGQTITRMPSVLFGILALISFAYVLRRWYGIRTAVFGTLLFGFSSWFLHTSRLATPDVLYLWAIPSLLALHIAWDRHIKNPFATLAAVAGLAIALYIPGLVWVVLVSLLLQSHELIAGWRNLKTWWLRAALIALFLVLVAPLGWAFLHTSSLIETWLGLPHTFGSPNDMVKRLADSVIYLFARGPQMPTLWLDTLPILDIFSMAMALAGVIFYIRHILAPRTRLLFGLFVVGAIFYALGGPVSYSIVVPIVYVVVVGGVGFVLHEWLHVFPKNPLARSIGFGLLGIAIGLSCLYNYRAYFIAWPHNSDTVVAFHNRR